MIKEEKINRRIAYKRVNENLNQLKNSPQTIESIFKITFSHLNYTFLQVVTNAGIKEITYHEAYHEIERLGTYLQANIGENSRYVGLLLDNKPEWIYAFYGLLMYGYIPVLLSTRNDQNDNQEILRKVNAKYLVSDLDDDLGVNLINPFSNKSNDTNHEHRWSNEVVFISSGTSGPNKIVSFTGQELCTQVFNGGDILKKNPDLASYYKNYLKHLVVLPFYHIFGFVAVLLWFSFFNVTFVLPMNLSLERIQQACVICEPTHIFAVPLFFETMVSQIKLNVKMNHLEKKFNKGIKLSIALQKRFPHLGLAIVRKVLFGKHLSRILGHSIKFCITGGSQISEEVLKIVNAIGYPLVNGYGSTEIGISSFADSKNIKTRLLPSIGRPFSIYTYVIGAGPHGKELFVKGDSMFHSALINNEWVLRNKEEQIRTFDAIDLKDEQYYLKGRVDEIFIGPNGENKSMSQIESSFALRHAKDVTLIKNQNNELMLLLSYASNASDYQIAHDLSILENSPEYIANHIQKIYATNLDFPRANGIKIKRGKVEELFKKNFEEFKLLNPSDFRDVLNNEKFDGIILNKVIEIFKQKYPNNQIDAHTDYFNDLNGNSLDYFYLVETIEKEFNLEVKNNLTLCRTPGEFAVKIKELSTL